MVTERGGKEGRDVFVLACAVLGWVVGSGAFPFNNASGVLVRSKARYSPKPIFLHVGFSTFVASNEHFFFVFKAKELGRVAIQILLLQTSYLSVLRLIKRLWILQ